MTVGLPLLAWQRPEITKQCLRSVRDSVPKWVDLSIYYTISKEDPFYSDLKKLCKYADYCFEFDNYPVSEKLNYTVSQMKGYDFLMNLGSDDIVTANMWEQYKPLFSEYYVFGYKDFYFSHSGNMYYTEVASVAGAGRMIDWECVDKLDRFVSSERNMGLDFDTMTQLNNMNYEEYAMNQRGVCIYGIKSEVGIHSLKDYDTKKVCDKKILS
jgi:hypothetical protein